MTQTERGESHGAGMRALQDEMRRTHSGSGHTFDQSHSSIRISPCLLDSTVSM